MQNNIEEKEYIIYAPLSGNVIPMEEIPDEIFSSGILGQGLGIQPASGEISAPFDGRVESIVRSKHALGLRSQDGIDLLIHIGVETVKMNGEGFALLVGSGDAIVKGQPLLRFDRQKIAEAGFSDIVVVMVANAHKFKNIEMHKRGEVGQLEEVIRVF